MDESKWAAGENGGFRTEQDFREHAMRSALEAVAVNEPESQAGRVAGHALIRCDESQSREDAADCPGLDDEAGAGEQGDEDTDEPTLHPTAAAVLDAREAAVRSRGQGAAAIDAADAEDMRAAQAWADAGVPRVTGGDHG